MSKKQKILLGAGVSLIAVIAVGFLLFWFHLSWMALEDVLPPDSITWKESDTIVILDAGTFDVIFHTNEPAAYIGSQRIEMREGIRIRGGKPSINMRDADTLNNGLRDALLTLIGLEGAVSVIVNGLYGQGTPEQNEMIHALLGNELARDRFEIYFQWCNTIHELGHAIIAHNSANDIINMSLRHMVDEEVLVNSFAIAFWKQFGEVEKLGQLAEAVDYVLSNITPPADGISHLDFMRAAVDEGRINEMLTFEIYGWFQFSIVQDILRNRDTLDLAEILSEMTGVETTQAPPQLTLVYPTLGTDIVPLVIADVISVLRNWGVSVPDIYVMFDTDPNQHSMQSVPRSLLESRIADGRAIPAVR